MSSRCVSAGVHSSGAKIISLAKDDQDEASRTAASLLTPAQKAKMPLVTHPLVRRHPVTGRKALYAVSGSSFGIVGMPDVKAVALLDTLAAHATRPEYRYSHSYRIGDVVIWDNASLLHAATLTDPDFPRTLWRITIKEPALAAPEVLLAPAFGEMGSGQGFPEARK